MRDIPDYTNSIVLPIIDDQHRALVLGECGAFGLMKTGWGCNNYNNR
jgi:hypothetical protein